MMGPVMGLGIFAAVALLIAINVTAGEDTHNISYTLGSSTTVCVMSIEYKSCTDAAMKLSYHPQHSNNSVGILFLNIVYNPDTVVATINTTEYGFSNITSERSSTNLCFHFIGMSEVANSKVLRIHQICGVTKLDDEKKHRLVFHLVLAPKTTSSTYAPTTIENSSESGLPSTNPSQRPDETERAEELSTGTIAGIIVGCIVGLLVIGGLIVLFFKCFKRQNGRTEDSPNNNSNLASIKDYLKHE